MSRIVLLATEKAFAPKARDQVTSILREAGYDARVLENYAAKADLLGAIADAEAVIVRSDVIDAEVLGAAKKLAIVVRAGAGVDTIDVAGAKERGVVVMNTPGQNANAVAELALGMMIYSARGLFDGATGTELRGRTLGLHAFGAVARALGKSAAGIGMKIRALDPFVPADAIRAAGAEPASNVEELYELSDYVSLHMPATAETKKSIGAALLLRMPKGGCLVNTARKEVIDEAGLIQALGERTDLRYVSDVEPGEKEKLQAFGKRVYWTPKKMGAQTNEANVNAGLAAARQIVGFFEKNDRTFAL